MRLNFILTPTTKLLTLRHFHTLPPTFRQSRSRPSPPTTTTTPPTSKRFTGLTGINRGVPPPPGDPSWEWFEGETTNTTTDELVPLEEGEEFEESGEPKRGTREIKFTKFGNRMVELPIPLKEVITDRLQDSSLNRLRENALRIFTSHQSLSNLPSSPSQFTKPKSSNSQRENRTRAPLESPSPHALTYGEEETLAYIAAVLPSNYASAHRVFSELLRRDPTFRPARVLDFGTGPGTALWAAREVWDESVFTSFRGVDLSEPMLEMANHLLTGSDHFSRDLLSKIQFDRHFSYIPGEAKYDMVVASHVLSEIPSDALRHKIVETLWDQCDDTLVVIERGTPRGFHLLDQIRSHVLNSNGYVMAPCSHDKPCPMAGTTRWCHFQQRLQRPRFLMDVKQSKSNLEFGAYSYLILRRGTRPTLPASSTTAVPDADHYRQSTHHWSRIVDQPSKRGSHAHIKTCSPNGKLETKVFTKSQGTGIYRDARKAHWGDLFPHDAKIVTPVKLHAPSPIPTNLPPTTGTEGTDH